MKLGLGLELISSLSGAGNFETGQNPYLLVFHSRCSIVVSECINVGMEHEALMTFCTSFGNLIRSPITISNEEIIDLPANKSG
jgi:hypothetical protein